MSLSIEIQGLTKSYKRDNQDLTVFNDFSLSIPKGEFVCILGQSGCGKSSLLKMIAGIEPFSEGEVVMRDGLGKVRNTAPGIVFQDPTLLPWLTVTENIALPFRVNGITPDYSEIQKVIKLVGLDGYQNASPKELSGGMAQRTAVARALIQDSEVLLLDEPFSALDPYTRREMQTEIHEIWKERNLTVVMVTHDLEEAISLGTKIVLLTPKPSTVYQILSTSDELLTPRSNGFTKIRDNLSSSLFSIHGELNEIQ